MAAKDLVQVACYLRPEQHENLKRLSAEAIVPMQVFLRQAVDDLLVKYKVQLKSPNPEILDHRILGLQKGGQAMNPNPSLALVYKTLSAAIAFQQHHAPGKIVVRIGRRFGLVEPATAKRLKLKGVNP